jgi:hypothetical protein
VSVERQRIARIACVTGHVSWGTFVVGRLMVEMNTVDGLPRCHADTLFGTGLGHFDSGHGWTAYTPLTEGSMVSHSFTSTNIIATVTAFALGATVTAAAVEAVAAGRWPAGIGTILAPVAAAAIIITALHCGSTYSGGLQLNPILVFVLVLAGVAMREVWSRGFAPHLQRKT